MTELIIIAAAWIGYGILHSILASLTCKQWLASRWPSKMPSYRLAYNALAIVLLIPPLWLTYRHESPVILEWPIWVSLPIALLVCAGVLWSVNPRQNGYDSQTFIGIEQLKKSHADINDQDALRISPLHRHVRHPWYSLGLLFLWTRDLNSAWLLSTSVLTLYLYIGSQFEEQKLLALHGEAYRRYRDIVPRLLPHWHPRLTQDEARQLQAMAHQHRAHQSVESLQKQRS